jgi:hypothetical protein
MVYFARTAALIEGLGVKYDPYFNPIAFASPIAIRMRSRILSSLAEPGQPSVVDWPTVVGAVAGRVIGMVARAGKQFVAAFTSELNAPGGFSFDRLFGTVAAQARQEISGVIDLTERRRLRAGSSSDEKPTIPPTLLAGD